MTYSTEKGDLTAGGGIQPALVWSNGHLAMHRLGDPMPEPAAPDAERVDATAAGADRGEGGLAAIESGFAGTPWIAAYVGDAADPGSRIAPVKVMHAVVPVDAGSRGLAAAKLSGRSGDALWNRFNWKSAVETGMEAAGVPFSGDVAFARVRQMIPVNHMVAPADQALACQSCHASDGLLASLPSGFVPRRDGFALLDWAGLAILPATLAASRLHAMARIGFGTFYRGSRHG
ncbi:MAG: hypothetical protein H5U12_21640 [Hoeflea sp.]|nr:hypothetical protein [Hoeflea sp.]